MKKISLLIVVSIMTQFFAFNAMATDPMKKHKIWTQQDDDLLYEEVRCQQAQYPQQRISWTEIASRLGRDGKSVREHYYFKSKQDYSYLFYTNLWSQDDCNRLRQCIAAIDAVDSIREQAKFLQAVTVECNKTRYGRQSTVTDISRQINKMTQETKLTFFAEACVANRKESGEINGTTIAAIYNQKVVDYNSKFHNEALKLATLNEHSIIDLYRSAPRLADEFIARENSKKTEQSAIKSLKDRITSTQELNDLFFPH